MLSRNSLAKISEKLFKSFQLDYNSFRGKRTVDRSHVPRLKESDLEEKFIKGSGPGGQKVNKSSSCVYLHHKPTGMSVKVHESRQRQKNSQIARERMTTILDNLENGEYSVENQKKKIAEDKTKKMKRKQARLRELKSKWKETLKDSE